MGAAYLAKLAAQDKELLTVFLRKPRQIFSREMLLDRLDMRTGGQRRLVPDAGHAAHLALL